MSFISNIRQAIKMPEAIHLRPKEEVLEDFRTSNLAWVEAVDRTDDEGTRLEAVYAERIERLGSMLCKIANL